MVCPGGSRSHFALHQTTDALVAEVLADPSIIRDWPDAVLADLVGCLESRIAERGSSYAENHIRLVGAVVKQHLREGDVGAARRWLEAGGVRDVDGVLARSLSVLRNQARQRTQRPK